MPTILSVGQCGYDDSRIGRLVREATGAFLDRAASAADAHRMIAEKKYDLILVNRIFDAGGEGLPFIEELKNDPSRVPVMLVSDYADAQASAVAHGRFPVSASLRLGRRRWRKNYVNWLSRRKVEGRRLYPRCSSGRKYLFLASGKRTLPYGRVSELPQFQRSVIRPRRSIPTVWWLYCTFRPNRLFGHNLAAVDNRRAPPGRPLFHFLRAQLV